MAWLTCLGRPVAVLAVGSVAGAAADWGGMWVLQTPQPNSLMLAHQGWLAPGWLVWHCAGMARCSSAAAAGPVAVAEPAMQPCCWGCCWCWPCCWPCCSLCCWSCCCWAWSWVAPLHPLAPQQIKLQLTFWKPACRTTQAHTNMTRREIRTGNCLWNTDLEL